MNTGSRNPRSRTMYDEDSGRSNYDGDSGSRVHCSRFTGLGEVNQCSRMEEFTEECRKKQCCAGGEQAIGEEGRGRREEWEGGGGGRDGGGWEGGGGGGGSGSRGRGDVGGGRGGGGRRMVCDEATGICRYIGVLDQEPYAIAPAEALNPIYLRSISRSPEEDHDMIQNFRQISHRREDEELMQNFRQVSHRREDEMFDLGEELIQNFRHLANREHGDMFGAREEMIRNFRHQDKAFMAGEGNHRSDEQYGEQCETECGRECGMQCGKECGKECGGDCKCMPNEWPLLDPWMEEMLQDEPLSDEPPPDYDESTMYGRRSSYGAKDEGA